MLVNCEAGTGFRLLSELYSLLLMAGKQLLYTKRVSVSSRSYILSYVMKMRILSNLTDWNGFRLLSELYSLLYIFKSVIFILS